MNKERRQDGGHAAVLSETIRQSARALEPDRYLSALLSPPSVRADLIALAAFAGETGRIGSIVSEPMIGVIRLQWWRDALCPDEKPLQPTGNPIADALQSVAAHHDIRGLIGVILDAHTEAIERPARAIEDIEAQCGAVEEPAFEAAAIILSAPPSNASRACFSAAGKAYGLARALYRGETPPRSSGAIAARARCHLALARVNLARAPKQIRKALLPLAMVEPYLQAQRSERGAAAPGAPLTRIWRLWRADFLRRI